MTAVLAIDFYYQILVIADCRVSWRGHATLQDNLQKVYPLGPTGIFAFSGSVKAARAILQQLRTQARGSPLPPSDSDIASDISRSARVAYSSLPLKDRHPIELMYVAPDYGAITMATENVTFARNVMVRMEQPDFSPIPQADAVRLGYARDYPMENIRLNRDNLLNAGLDPLGQTMLIGIAIGSFAPNLAKLAPTQVGGLFSVGTATARGVGWRTYGPINGLELARGRQIHTDRPQLGTPGPPQDHLRIRP